MLSWSATVTRSSAGMVLTAKLFQEGGAAGRQPVTDFQAFGESERLQFANVGLEDQHLLTGHHAQISSTHRRMRLDCLERLASPRRACRSGIQSLQTGKEPLELRSSCPFLAERDARIGFERSQLDAVNPAGLPFFELIYQLRQGVVAGSFGVSVRNALQVDDGDG